MDYAFHKVSPGHYLLFSNAKVLNKEQDKASILGQLRKFTEQIRTQAKEKQRTRGGEGRTLSDKIRKYVLPNLPYLFADCPATRMLIDA